MAISLPEITPTSCPRFTQEPQSIRLGYALNLDILRFVKDKIEERSKETENPLRAYAMASSGNAFASFTLLESPRHLWRG
jgi:hypothetical protein